MKAKNMLFITGPSLIGKTTLAYYLAKQLGEKGFNFRVISVGEEVRKVLASGPSSLKDRIEERLNRKGFILVEDLISLLEFREDEDIILEGLPRNVEQFENETFRQWLREGYLIYMYTDNIKDLTSRIGNRRLCSSCNSVNGLENDSRRCQKCGATGNFYIRSDDTEERIMRENDQFKTDSFILLLDSLDPERLLKVNVAKYNPLEVVDLCLRWFIARPLR